MGDKPNTKDEKWPSYTMVDPRMRKIYFQFYQETYKSSVLDRKTKELLGQRTTVYPADTASGKYRGEVLGETDHHVLQKLSPRSVVAHPKQALLEAPAAGANVIISYSNNLAQVKPNQLREKAQALSR